jgi:hypothetical protein
LLLIGDGHGERMMERLAGEEAAPERLAARRLARAEPTALREAGRVG